MYCILTYIYHKNQLNVGKYTSPMDGMGIHNRPITLLEVKLGGSTKVILAQLPFFGPLVKGDPWKSKTVKISVPWIFEWKILRRIMVFTGKNNQHNNLWNPNGDETDLIYVQYIPGDSVRDLLIP